VLAALRRSGAVPRDSVLPTLRPSPRGDDAQLPLLVHGLDELASPVVLVFDDVHELTEPRVLGGIEFLIRYAPPQHRGLDGGAAPGGRVMQHQPDRHRFVIELAGDERSLAGYLVSEVLERQPAELRSFLLRTCVVQELSGELADALTGRDDGERTLARPERANAFVVACAPARSAPGWAPTSGPCASAPSPRPLWPWSSGADPPARSSSA